MSNFKVYMSNELSNEEYHADTDYVSGSGLCIIHADCPAMYRYGEHKDSPALKRGTEAHAMMLEPSRFSDEFICGLRKESYEGLLTSNKDIESWLKERGIKGYAGKKYEQLLELVDQTGEKPFIWKRELDLFEKANEGKNICDPDDFDMYQQMRAVILADKEYAAMLDGGFTEVSVFGEIDGVKVKVRFDLLTNDARLRDYKTTITSEPVAFGKQCFNLGYWLKMALQHDMFEAAYGYPPLNVGLLAQSKSAPYIPQDYKMTKEQLQIGRDQYKIALQIYKHCKETDSWPAYGGGTMDLPTPDFVKRMYKMD
jgi:hypothetical protein